MDSLVPSTSTWWTSIDQLLTVPIWLSSEVITNMAGISRKRASKPKIWSAQLYATRILHAFISIHEYKLATNISIHSGLISRFYNIIYKSHVCANRKYFKGFLSLYKNKGRIDLTTGLHSLAIAFVPTHYVVVHVVTSVTRRIGCSGKTAGWIAVNDSLNQDTGTKYNVHDGFLCNTQIVQHYTHVHVCTCL